MRTLSRLNFYGTHFFSVELIEGKFWILLSLKKSSSCRWISWWPTRSLPRGRHPQKRSPSHELLGQPWVQKVSRSGHELNSLFCWLTIKDQFQKVCFFTNIHSRFASDVASDGVLASLKFWKQCPVRAHGSQSQSSPRCIQMSFFGAIRWISVALII